MISLRTNALIEKLEDLINSNKPFTIEARRSFMGRFGTYNGFYFRFEKVNYKGDIYTSNETLDSRSKKRVKVFLESKGISINSDYDATNWTLNFSNGVK
jgi:hypothetical protein